MWMVYVQVEIKDFESAIRNVRQQFSSLSFDAYHEANYGMGKIMSIEECIKLGDRYDVGKDACDDLLEGEIGHVEWFNTLKSVDLEGLCYEIKSFLPSTFCEMYLKDINIDEEEIGDDEEEDFNGDEAKDI